MTRNISEQATRFRHFMLGPALTSIGLAMGVSLAWSSDAHASQYRVYTASAATSMTVANDGICTLAEAVMHVNGQNGGVTYCQDFSPGGQHKIEFRESAGKSFSANHFKITKLTFTTTVPVWLAGGGASIDSTSNTSAFVVGVKNSASKPTVFFEFLTLTNTAGSAGGRLIENYGTLRMLAVTITKGDVTLHQNGFGGGIYNAGTIDSAASVYISENRAKKGGGLYNDGTGVITQLGSSVIANNYAAQAGGGIYNAVTGPTASGQISTSALGISGNSARTGGGIFNRGWVQLSYGSYITGNKTLTTGQSGETCTGVSCNGMGGGVVSVHPIIQGMDLSLVQTRFNLMFGSTLSENEASVSGGGVTSAGNLELSSITMNANKAPDGAAIYVVSPTDGASEYCNVTGDDEYGPTVITNNDSTSPGYSIVSGGAVNPSNRCSFKAGYVTASGNDTPRCKSSVIREGFFCPQ